MFKIFVSLNAQEDIETAEFYYSKISQKISNQFIDTISETYFLLETNPFFSIRYKNYHAVSVSKFPYLLFFEIDEGNKIVYILSCFHTSQNPKKYPI